MGGSEGLVRAMTFQQLTFAVEVAKCASINKAAERLYTHQSNVSNTLKQLETELGIQLFHRTQKGVSLTPEGKEFLSYADDIIDRMDFIENLYKVRHRCHLQYFNVSSMRGYFFSNPIIQMQSLFAEHRESPVYCRLVKRAFDDVIDDVALAQSDLGILFVLKSQEKKLRQACSIRNLSAHKLGESKIHIVLREDHPLTRDKSLKTISKYPYVIVEENENFGQLYDESSRSIFQLLQDTPNCIISINDSMACQDIVAATDAFFISSTPYRHTDHYSFTSIPLSGDDNILSHYYIVRKNWEITPMAQAYLHELEQMFEEVSHTSEET